MENILLFALTVTVYSLVMGLIIFNMNNFSWTRFIKNAAVIVLLVLPINIGGNVFTFAGNATAEKSIYSIFSLYQKAGQDAFTGIGPVYQNAGRDAVTFVGLAGYQKAGRDAATVVGLAGYQKAGQDALTAVGPVYQNAGRDALTAVGLVYQKAGRDAKTFAGLVYQNAGQDAVTFAGLAYQNAGRDAVTFVGLAWYQKAERGTKVPIAIAIYQRVGEKTRAFGAFSTLTKD